MDLKNNLRYNENMFNEYIKKKLKLAKYKLLENGDYFGEIKGVPGVWANAKNLENCRQELKEVLEDWFLLKISSKEKVPGFETKIGSHVNA